MIRLAIAGLGKMGISHLAIARAHPSVDLVAVCDTSTFVLDALAKYGGLRTFADYTRMLDEAKPDAVIVATPSRSHETMVSQALEAGAHVFCEKPFCLSIEGGRQLAKRASELGLVNQVGYHSRFIATFVECRRLVSDGAIGKVHAFQAEAYGPVVVRDGGFSWRAQSAEGGGCLLDYACHAIDLVNFAVSAPTVVRGASMQSIFSRGVDDAVYATLKCENGAVGQLAANWSDASQRKMSTKLTVWGSNGHIAADRQQLSVYLVKQNEGSRNLVPGWNTQYTTELTEPVAFYLRGEEYSSQIEHFISAIETGNTATRSTFTTAAMADGIADMIRKAASEEGAASHPQRQRERQSWAFWGKVR